ncbi:UDP-N-acetylglucosamine 2-epimerase [Chryseolinea sp. H1M3-3]|uniref:UDP-N-acetylglucosamine 2-epimerase n=1 Tax=Chryseolinea sp. H1M3-3 TaxID=3034144 RepID=UPI0023ED749E|nr:UDP-N-acetylglucosamine 2-epimerase [Chryseolinea sp. H1M3-3]
MKRIGILTSSRADYGIYYPLLKKLQSDSFFSLSVIAFGTHLSAKFGHTVDRIKEDGFIVTHELDTMPPNDSPEGVSIAMGKTILAFSSLWVKEKFDVVLCLGDRYEIFAACASSIPYNVKLAHLHGGEETLGAIDDCLRHSITHMSTIHFTVAEPYRQRVVALKGSDKNVFNTGSLSIDNLKHLKLFTIEEFKKQFNIDLSIPTILITFHPETVSYEKNDWYVNELVGALEELTSYQLVITMPNADTMGNVIREKLNQFIGRSANAIGVESFGMLGYLSCMKHCSLMLGNTSSGYVEASFFPKYVIDLGTRQNGRIVTENIRKCDIEKTAILKAVNAYSYIQLPSKIDIYGSGESSDYIVKILKEKND